MTLIGRPAWIELPLFGAFVALAIVSAFFHIWLAVGAHLVFAAVLLPRIVAGFHATRRGERWSAREVIIPVGVSKAQLIAAGSIIVAGLVAWRLLQTDMTFVVIVAPFFLVDAVWFVRVVRAEGWNGNRHDQEPSSPNP